mmetsp:Transcript_44135/g.110923  ORF Transcript_44135/g.110923 Transcript_44135/m.110923 type:complete len:277 (+) Transcript_44135:641-1471(+)
MDGQLVRHDHCVVASGQLRVVLDMACGIVEGQDVRVTHDDASTKRHLREDLGLEGSVGLALCHFNVLLAVARALAEDDGLAVGSARASIAAGLDAVCGDPIPIAVRQGHGCGRITVAIDVARQHGTFLLAALSCTTTYNAISAILQGLTRRTCIPGARLHTARRFVGAFDVGRIITNQLPCRTRKSSTSLGAASRLIEARELRRVLPQGLASRAFKATASLQATRGLVRANDAFSVCLQDRASRASEAAASLRTARGLVITRDGVCAFQDLLPGRT